MSASASRARADLSSGHPGRGWFFLFFLACLPWTAWSIGPAVAAPDPATSRDDLTIAEVLSRMRQAGSTENLRRAGGLFSFHGLETNADLRMDWSFDFTADGRYLQKSKGLLGLSAGFDGTNAWATDVTGMPRRVVLGELDFQQTATWVMSGQWLLPDLPLRIEFHRQTADSLVLKVARRDGRQSMLVTVDRQRWLPVQVTGFEAEWDTLRFEDFRITDGFRFPHRVVRRAGGTAEVVEVAGSAVSSLPDSTFFSMPARPTDDVSFDDTQSPAIEVVRARNRHFLVHPKLDGQDVGWFVLDTGASHSGITAEAADRLRMPAFGACTIEGWKGTEVSRFRQGKAFELGPIRISGTKYLELPASMIGECSTVPIAGICGYDLLSRSVVEIDVKGQSLRIFSPQTYQLTQGEWQPLRLPHQIPAVEAILPGERKEFFLIDSGAAPNVILNAWLARVLGVELSGPQMGHPGGFQQVDFPGLTLGGRHLDLKYAVVSRLGSRVVDDPSLGGTLGRRLLHEFTVVLDYRHERVAFVPHQHPPVRKDVKSGLPGS